MNQLKNIILESENYLRILLECKSVCNKDIPSDGGVYAIYNKETQIIYIGEARNLRRRILQDHFGGDVRMSTSTLRRSIHRGYNIPAGAPVRDWMKENCTYSYVVIPDHDMRNLVEKLAITFLRKEGSKLLNFYR